MQKLLQVLAFELKKDCGTTDLFIELAKQGKDRGIQTDFVFTGLRHEKLQQELACHGSTLHVVQRPWNNRSFGKEILALLERERPDAADFHFCASWIFAHVFRNLRRRRVKTLFHYHGEIRPVQELRFHHRHFSRLRILTAFVDQIICVSHANRRFLENHNIKTPIDVVYNGISTDKYTLTQELPDMRSKLGLSPDDFLLFYMGSMIHRKGIDVLLQALATARRHQRNLKLVLIGGGDYAPYRRQAEALGVSDAVSFLGFRDDYPYEAFKAADLYVSASRAESFGLSIAEAQLMGVPVVSTSVGGVPEVVCDGETGLLVPSESPEALAQAITRVAESPELRSKFSRNGPGWIRRNFEIKERVTQLLDLTQQVVDDC